MGYKFWKSIVLTAILMGLSIYVYILADTYLYAVSAILNGILVVAGFISISLLVFLVLYLEPEQKRKTPPWEAECKRAGKYR